MRDRYYLSCLFFGFVIAVSVGVCFFYSERVGGLDPFLAQIPLWSVMAFAFLIGMGLRGVDITTFTLSKPDYVAAGATRANTSYVTAALAQALHLVVLGLVLKVLLLDPVARLPAGSVTVVPSWLTPTSVPPILRTYVPALAGAMVGIPWGLERRADERGTWLVVVALTYAIIGAIIGLIVWVATWDVVTAYAQARGQPSPFSFEATAATLLGFGAVGALLNLLGRFGFRRRERAAFPQYSAP